MSDAPALPPPAPPSPTPPAPATGARHLPRRLLWSGGVLALVAVASPFAVRWVSYRTGHSITDDAFVEAHIVNVAPQSVSGRIVRFLVDENDRVKEGEPLVEIDPVPYRDQVELADSKLATAQAELRRQEAALGRLKKEVPLQVELARRSLAAARADHAKAEEAHKLTEEEAAKGIDEARPGLDAARAGLILARQ